MRRCGNRVPKPSLPVRLALLVAGTTLPLIIFAAVLVFNGYEQSRKEASQRVLETVRSIRLVLDADVQRMTGALKVRPIVTVEVPVLGNGEVLYVMSFSPPIEIFQTIIEKQRPGEDWTISIFDSEGTNFARVPSPQVTVGKHASPTLYAQMFPEPEATLRTVSLEGVSPLTGWTVAAGVAESSLAGPLWRNLAITSVIGSILLLVGLAFAVRMATTIARGEMLHALLIEELNHRVKNTLAILQSIAAQTFRSASRAEREKFEGRLGALAEAHNLLSQEKWQGSELQDVIARVLNPYLLNNPDRVRMTGPAVPLSPRLAVVLSMILHEIATNAAKYGALSNDTGTIALDWEVTPENAVPKLRLIWTEAGGPHVSAPIQRGL